MGNALCSVVHLFFFFNDTATTEIYTLSLHDALPISARGAALLAGSLRGARPGSGRAGARRSEEHTSELQSPNNLVCRLLLETTKAPTRREPHSTTMLRSHLITCLPRSVSCTDTMKRRESRFLGNWSAHVRCSDLIKRARVCPPVPHQPRMPSSA